MKKFFSFFLLLTALVLAAEETTVLCTTTPITAFTKVVLKGVPGYRVEQLLPQNIGCPHDYALTPFEVKRLAKAKVIVKNGLGMEAFLDEVLKRLHSNVIVIDSSKDVHGIIAESGHHDHGMHEVKKHEHHITANEHLFAAPSTAAEVVASIVRSFSKYDPGHASFFRKNGNSYIEKLKKISAEYAVLAKYMPKDKRNVAVQHSIFDYLVRECGLHAEICIQEHAGQEPSPARIRHLIKEIREEKVCVIFAETQAPAKVTSVISRETGIPVAYLDMNPEFSDPERFLKMFQANLKKIKGILLKK